MSTSKPKKATTVTQKLLLAEFQALIAHGCYDSPALSCGGVSMTERAQEKLMAKLCFGAAEDDPELICYAEQFLHGLNKFSSLYTASCDEIQPGGCSGAPAEMTFNRSM